MRFIPRARAFPRFAADDLTAGGDILAPRLSAVGRNKRHRTVIGNARQKLLSDVLEAVKIGQLYLHRVAVSLRVGNAVADIDGIQLIGSLCEHCVHACL